MATITEIAPDVYRISIYVEPFDLQFNHFLIDDDEPLLHHAGMRGVFPELREAVAKIIDPSKLRWISLSHFEMDECGALNNWLGIAPQAQAACSAVGAIVNLNDFADRPPRGLEKGEIISTGKHRISFHPTPHLPHGWDAGMFFDETTKTLFCSDLLHQGGNAKPIDDSEDILERSRKTIGEYQAGPLMNYVPYMTNTKRFLGELADLKPKTLAIMHGSSFTGNGERILRNFDSVLKEVLGQEQE
jgi:flavorubredoxin